MELPPYPLKEPTPPGAYSHDMVATEEYIKIQKSENMKRLTVFLIMICMGLPIAAYSQNVDLRKLPKEDREKQLLEIAVAAMKRYAPSYYKDDLIPGFYDDKINNKRDPNYGRPIYVVGFPYDLEKAVEENREGENVYGGAVYIYSDTGKAFAILPVGWVVMFEIPDDSSTRGSNAPHPVAEPTKVPANPFKRK
jgi:hypothetical protein